MAAMPASLWLAVAAGGAIYIITPGPAFLALLGIGAARGRRAAMGFVAGNLVGDLVWNILALIALIGARRIGSGFFAGLDVGCGVYLSWLGARALLARRDGAAAALVPRRPLLRGLAFGLSNPKGYPVALATFAALLSGRAATIDAGALPALLVALGGGIVAADLTLVLLVGMAPVRRFHARHGLWMTRAAGLVFLGFGMHALSAGATRLLTAHRLS